MNTQRQHPAPLWAILTILACAWMLHSCEPARAEVSEVVLQTIAMESADQPFGGQVAVAQVLLNRARLRGTSPEVEALRPKQFSCWNDPKWAQEWLDSHFSEATRHKAKKALKMASTPDFLKFNRLSHYHHVSIKPYWAIGHTPSLVIGSHAFYEGIK